MSQQAPTTNGAPHLLYHPVHAIHAQGNDQIVLCSVYDRPGDLNASPTPVAYRFTPNRKAKAPQLVGLTRPDLQGYHLVAVSLASKPGMIIGFAYTNGTNSVIGLQKHDTSKTTCRQTEIGSVGGLRRHYSLRAAPEA